MEGGGWVWGVESEGVERGGALLRADDIQLEILCVHRYTERQTVQKGKK